MWTAAQVLDAYAGTVGRLRRPAGEFADYITFYMNQQAEAVSGQAAPFYPVVPDGGRFSMRDGEEFARIVGDGLAGAPAYQVTGGMCGKVEVLARQVYLEQEQRNLLRRPLRAGTVRRAADLPSPNGFAWLDKPVDLIADEDGSSVPGQAVSWSLQRVRVREGEIEGVRAAVWMLTPGPGDDPGQARPARSILGPVNLAYTDIWPLGTPLGKGGGTSAEKLLCYMKALWIMLQAETAGTGRTPVGRAVRRRAERMAGQGEIQVITLRRRPPGGLQPGPGPKASASGKTPVSLDWPFQVEVKGHFRHHRAPFEDRHRPLPSADERSCAICGSAVSKIPEYRKGPEGGELRVTRRLNRLSR